MRITDDCRRTVVFLGWQEAGPADEAPISPKGTAFLMHGGKTLGGGALLVTAKHVADKLHAPFVIRFNRKGGGAGLVHIELLSNIRWCAHPTDASVDIAAAPIVLPDWIDAASYDVDDIFGKDRDGIATISAGDEAYVVGLFHLHHGKMGNAPIVHTGHIAMMPSDEKIPVDGVMVEGYLVQTNAISGCSGSPVFATRTMILPTEGGGHVAAYSGQLHLIGVWSSSWKVKRSEIVAVRTDDDDGTGTLAPLGMGIVTPVSKLGEILTGDDFRSAHQEMMKQWLRSRSATEDAASTLEGAS